MKISQKRSFYLLLLLFLVILPTSSASADTGRYLVKSTKSFWKNALGVRNTFDNGFTTDLSDFQVRFTRVFGVEIEPVKVLQILPSDKLAANPLPTSTRIIKSKKGSVRFLPTSQISWGVRAVYNENLLESTSGGKDVNVAVLDTGVDVTHPDLKNRIAKCKDFSNPKSSIVDSKCDDKNGHGTHVAGIVSADAGIDGLGIYGVAPAAKLFAYKVCDSNGSCYADDVAIAIKTAMDDGANIINMSFGSDGDSQLIKDAINYASSKGGLLVAAAGNDGPFENSIDYPAAYAPIVSVAAVNQLLDVTEWSSRGINLKTKLGEKNDGDIEFAAPGENIESTWNNGSYVILSGTSMSAPFISGLAAKFWQFSSDDPAKTTREFIKSLSSDISSPGEDNLSGYGFPQIK